MSNKKNRDLTLFVVDIFVAIEKIKEYIEPFDDEESLRHSSLHWDATIRQLEIIGEALNTLLADNLFEEKSPSYFRKIVNFRNAIVHGYFGIDTDEVWNVVNEKLKILYFDLLSLAKDNFSLEEALDSEIEEYLNLKDKHIVNYLLK